ncbi:MAG: hypothetical protein R3303_05670 [Marinobacter sp.]|nr:hypothetical protein [Marinobacter sp.]
MGFFDSKSSSDTTTTNKNTTFNNVDYGGGGGGSGLAKNVNLADSTLSVGGDVISTDHGAVAGSLDFAQKAGAANTALTMNLADSAYADTAQSRKLTGDLFNGAISSVNDANKTSLQFLSQNTDRALAFAQKATRSEGGQIVADLTKKLLIGGSIIAGLIFIKGRA